MAVAVTGFFQTTINMGSTTMALAGGGAGRTAVLVFTMPFWTLLLAWPVLGERVRGIQWLAIAFALVGLALVVEPWHWEGELEPRMWAVLSGFGWAAGTIAMKYFQRARGFDMLNFIAWQMLIGILPLSLLPLALAAAGRAVERDVRVVAAVDRRAVDRRSDSCCGSRVLRFLPAGTASLNMLAIPVIALAVVDAGFRRAPGARRVDRHRLHRRGPRHHFAAGLARDRRGERRRRPVPLEGG